jgi:hypothetical protein
MARIRKDVAALRFRSAARQLLVTWEHSDPHFKTPQQGYQLMCEKRDLLTRCYAGMKRDDVCGFVQVAPIEHIRQYLIYGDCDADKSFPSGETYLHRLWVVQGETLDGKTGMYEIQVPNLGPIDVYSTSPRFPAFFKILGPLKRSVEGKNVAPLPRDLMDAEQFGLPG